MVAFVLARVIIDSLAKKIFGEWAEVMERLRNVQRGEWVCTPTETAQYLIQVARALEAKMVGNVAGTCGGAEDWTPGDWMGVTSVNVLEHVVRKVARIETQGERHSRVPLLLSSRPTSTFYI